MRSIVLVAALLLAACGSTLSGGSPSPLASATPPASPAPTGALPGSVVRVTVNGMPYSHGVDLQLTPSGSPVVIEMAFPFAVDKSSVERWPPKAPAVIWTDERTARLTFPESESNIGFKIAETLASDNSAVISWFTVNVVFPATRVIDLFTIGELNAITTGGPRTAATAFRISSAGRLTVSPDGRRAIEYEAIARPGRAAPAMIDLASRTRTPIAQPAISDGPFAFADWLPDGRVLLIGRDVWVGLGDGSAMQKLADAAAAVSGTPWTAVPSPSGDRVAIWGYNADGHITVVDLKNGSAARVAGPFRRSAADARVSLAWSRDGAVLAGTDSDSETGPAKARVRIVDIGTDRTVRTIDGGANYVSSFPTGELLVVRDSGQQGEGAQALGVVMGFDGVERRRYLGGGWFMSPDTRYLLQPQLGGAGYLGYTRIDLTTGGSFGFGLPGSFGRWLTDGRLAFY